MKWSFSQMKKKERMFWGGKEDWSKKWNSSKALLLTNTAALKRSCSAWILIQSINKWIMQLVDIQLTGFTTHVELTGSACICMTVMRLNEYAIKGHAVEWWIRFVWGRESCLPAAESAADKALVRVGKRNKNSTMQDPKWHSLCCSSIVLPRWVWTEINKSQILLCRKDEQLDLDWDLSINHQPRAVLAAQDENLLAQHSHPWAMQCWLIPMQSQSKYPVLWYLIPAGKCKPIKHSVVICECDQSIHVQEFVLPSRLLLIKLRLISETPCYLWPKLMCVCCACTRAHVCVCVFPL